MYARSVDPASLLAAAGFALAVAIVVREILVKGVPGPRVPSPGVPGTRRAAGGACGTPAPRRRGAAGAAEVLRLAACLFVLRRQDLQGIV